MSLGFDCIGGLRLQNGEDTYHTAFGEDTYHTALPVTCEWIACSTSTTLFNIPTKVQKYRKNILVDRYRRGLFAGSSPLTEGKRPMNACTIRPHSVRMQIRHGA